MPRWPRDELEVPLLDGRQNLAIPAGTQPGEIIRLRGKGMPDPHSRRKRGLLVADPDRGSEKVDAAAGGIACANWPSFERKM